MQGAYSRPHQLLIERNFGFGGRNLRKEGREGFDQIEKPYCVLLDCYRSRTDPGQTYGRSYWRLRNVRKDDEEGKGEGRVRRPDHQPMYTRV